MRSTYRPDNFDPDFDPAEAFAIVREELRLNVCPRQTGVRKRRKYRYAKHDKKTVTLLLDRTQAARLEHFSQVAGDLWNYLLKYSDDQHPQSGRFLEAAELSRLLPQLKKSWPDLKELPGEEAQSVTRLVADQFNEFMRRGPDPIPAHLDRAAALAARAALPAWMQRRRANSLHFTRVLVEHDLGDEEFWHEEFGNGEIGRLWLPKTGWVKYAASQALREVLAYQARIKGARVWKNESQWRATISFERKPRIKQVTDEADKVGDDALLALGVVYCMARSRFPDFDKYFAPHRGRIRSVEIRAEIRATLRTRGVNLTPRGIGKLLREVGLKPRQLWIEGRNVQGYRERDIIRAWLQARGEDWFDDYEPGNL